MSNDVKNDSENKEDFNKTLDKVIDVASDTLKINKEKISPDSLFVKDLELDSLDMVELVMALEAAFDCEIPEEQAEKITSVKEAAEHITKLKSG
ncbi:acyl carrier protein [Candidatus Sneabacter namystus]|uniref:Acyl carrier protein n=1 Tax=Candidatus Sneabacter namystus TaxID=2601646 RepID=A0A5C0UJT3_9RICK|nr:acyl carrier protein [Candidatus Sneabacter namystus]QEK39793.1 acyl carrier protein [Candidatus Sneabacter namystus]